MTLDQNPHLASFASFVTASPTSYHAAAEAARRLDEAGFTGLDEREAWPSGPGLRYVVRDGAVIAWVQPESQSALTPFRIVGAHTDSPSFKLKPNPDTGSFGWQQAGVEVYGGPLFNSWLDRDLEFAGRLVTSDGAVHLVRTGPVLRFPQLAVHLDRGVNAEGLKLDPQRHLHPIVGLAGHSGHDILASLAASAGVDRRDVRGHDVLVADTAAPSLLGFDGELFASGRMDNLTSVHAGLTALIDGAAALLESSSIAVFAAFDHEEVGSATVSGASGPFLADVLRRISAGHDADDSDRMRAFAASWCLSSDAGHAVHPNYPERHDPANHPVPNGGPLLKINAQQRYATDGPGSAEWARSCEQAGVPFQTFVSNNAVPCGSTIGPLTATRLGIRTIDVGVPLLSMHSARELCGSDDPGYLASAAGAFLAPAA
ncbi:putative M18 family aminopeptidase 2 [Frondihabitans sucicola]|uniref:M18 family aminopeptidase n=1 Tax=Frondihabitans sucicola TaxID=1268041 RepID=A0ABN6Y6U5_9MICO|nr:M18 family aminopeptidase [Frondihabitans sucicola]BDZ51872.1 putative M18 family aminopeptidase 2 [Frondihabitans sucicola]